MYNLKSTKWWDLLAPGLRGVLFFAFFVILHHTLVIGQPIVSDDPPISENLQSERTKEYYHLTKGIHTELESYTNELIGVINSYLYREDKLTIDEFIAQILPVFKGTVAQTKYNVWTINHLLYLETFHEAWEQENPKAYQVIIDYMATTIATIEDDATEIQELPLKAPSMTEVPFLMRHYKKTKELLHKTHITLQKLSNTIPKPSKSQSDETLVESAI